MPSKFPIRDAVVLAVLLGCCVGCDQVTKQVAIEHLADVPASSYLGDLFRLTYIENRGAFLGMGSGWSDSARFLVFVIASTLMVCGALVVTLKRLSVHHGSSTTHRSLRRVFSNLHVLGPALVVAGGLGNLVDRARNDGAVVDFMNLGVGPVRSGIFNVADVYIVLGIVLWLWASRRPDAGQTSGVPPTA